MLDKLKNQYIPRAKSILIIGLTALAVVLTARLWLMYIPNHTFVPYVMARFAPTVPDEASDLVRPFRILQGNGDGYFAVIYIDIADSPQWKYGETVITGVLRDGIFTGVEEADIRIFDRPVLIYQYAFNMEAEVFAQAFGQRTGAVLMEGGILHFTAVAVTPSDGDSDNLAVFFIGDTYMWQFILPTAQAMFNVPSAANELHHFVATGNMQFESRLTRNLHHSVVLVTNPYRDHAGQLSLAHIRGQVSHFFANPATINQGVSADGVFTFNNMSTVVRYMPWDVIEYRSFRTIGHSSPTGLVTDFSAAFAFILSDPNAHGSFFLANYEERPRGERVFWFDYTIGNFPMRLTENWYTGPECENPLTHPIEVTVVNGRVTRYRRIAHSFALDPGMFSPVLMRDLGHGQLGFLILPRSQMRSHIVLQAME